MLVKIDGKLSNGRQFLVGEKYSMADLIATVFLARVHFCKQETVFSDNVKAYFERMRQRNSFASAPILYHMEDFDSFAPYQ